MENMKYISCLYRANGGKRKCLCACLGSGVERASNFAGVVTETAARIVIVSKDAWYAAQKR